MKGPAEWRRIVVRYRSKCVRCHRWIECGEIAEWRGPSSGIRHVAGTCPE